MSAIDSGLISFPVELLTTFFLACIPYPTQKNPGPPPSRNHPAVVLSHVCHDWREIALNTPELWSKLHIKIPHPPPVLRNYSLDDWRRKCESKRETNSVWLERSASCPLTIMLTLHSTYRPAYCDIHMSVLNDVTRSSRRWREVLVKIGPGLEDVYYLVLATQNLSADDFTILASLSISVETHLYTNSSTSLSIFTGFLDKSVLLTGPMLRHVTLSGFLCMAFARVTHPFEGWAPLTELTVDPCPLLRPGGGLWHTYHFDTCFALKLLRSLPQLRQVSFKFISQSPQQDHKVISWIPVTLPHLHSLTLRGVPMEPEFARSLTLPSLNAMSLIFDTYYHISSKGRTCIPPPGYSEGIMELLQQFGPQVTALALNPELLTLESFPSCLSYLDGERLCTLSLINTRFPMSASGPNIAPDDGRRELHCAALVYLANPSVLPNLKTFEMTIRNAPHDDTLDQGLIDVISVRRTMHGLVEGGSGEEEEIAGIYRDQACVGNELTANSRVAPSTSLRHVHIAFSSPSKINIIDELRRRRVDLDGEDPLNLRLNYPESRELLGRVAEGIWGERR